EHIPMIRFEGKIEPNPTNGTIVFHQMNYPVAKLTRNSTGELLAPKGHERPSQYSDFWGMKHFAMARLLTQAELLLIHPGADVDKGLLYLELTHHPSLQG